ncbi:MAG: hypothetical protein V7609_2750 [Verrucomicrobiota bacterium]
MPNSEISVVPIGPKICKPFLLEVMIFSPEAGYKFSVSVERSCTKDADPLWKLVFDLYQVADDGKETQLVHVSYKAQAPVEQSSVKKMVSAGVNQGQADALINDVHPAAKAVEGKTEVTPEEQKRVLSAMKKVVSVSG